MTKDEIFDKYLEDKCPVCDGKVDGNHYHTETITGGKIMAKYFTCTICDKTPADGEYMWWMGSETWCEECCEREQAIANEEAQQNL